MKSEAGKSSAASDSLDVEQEAEGKNDGKMIAKDEPGRLPQKDRKRQSWRISIGKLKVSGNPGNKPIGGRIVQKSGLRTYQTRNKEKKFFFNLGVADETGSIKVVVYGKEHYQDIQEKSCYMFRNVIMEGNDIKVTKLSIVSKTSQIDVPENLEMEARMLVDFQTPVCSIEQANRSAEKTLVSVGGKVAEVQSAAVQSVTIEIIGIIRASGTQTELEAELSHNIVIGRLPILMSAHN
ncbi:uncharacterized protein LOC120442234 [Oreochromis aureus]|uniref:uncharacterized protein LOC120442234 n=1 Tax=Oreochromis aureus TaxID=47969 RepID=UPI001953C74C|nr:uncharacterized protein LOC120442234 [Oreochromis aureus]